MVLKLDDPRWGQLTSFFGDGADIPTALREWLGSIATSREADVYADGVSELVLHQLTITNGAFALTPWLLSVCARADTPWRWRCITDVAIIEANRLSYGVYYNVEGTDPGWLMEPYVESIKVAARVASDMVAMDRKSAVECGLLALMPAFQGDGDSAWQQWRNRYPS